ncbi:MAG: hypothetical protein ACLQPD_35585, partial [Desulfomonilaceae bacterium]
RLIPINVIVKLKQYVIRTFSTNFSSKIRQKLPITNKDRSVMQASRTGFQPVIPVGWASSPSIKWDG